MIASPVIASKPHLWAADLNAIISLSTRFATGDLFNIPENLERGMHIIWVDSRTPELIVRKAIYRILASGSSLEIYQSQQPAAILAGDESLSPAELMGQIAGYAQPLEKWLEKRSQEKLSLKDAAEIAKVVLAFEQEPQRSVELGTLRVRCGESSYDWNKLMKELEKEFLEEVGKRSTNISGLSLRDRIAEILERGLNSSLEKQALVELAKQSSVSCREVDVLADLVRYELDREIYRDENQKEVAELIKLRPALNIADYLPKQLAEVVIEWCKLSNTRPEAALTGILATISSLHKTGTKLVIHRKQGFSVIPTLFAALVAASGQKKSPIIKNMITAPLKGLKDEAKAKYESDLRQYAIDLREWEQKKGEDKGFPPEKPVQKVFYFNSSTGEGIQRRAQDAPSKTLFMLGEELKGVFDSANLYRNGRGSDRQDILSYYDGFGQTTLRATGISIDVDEIYISIFGGIQPDVLKTHTKDLADTDGYWARFFFVNQPLAAGDLDDDTGDFDFAELLGGYYRRVHALGKRTYTLPLETLRVYQPVYRELERKRVSHPSPGMRAIYAKLEGQIGRLALNLHAIEEVESGLLRDQISPSTMRKAIVLANFYLGEVIDLHADSRADKGDLPALLAKLLEYANEKGSLVPRDAVIKFNAIKNSPQALDHFRELEAMSYGTVEKQKRNWVFIPTQDSCNGSRNERNGSRNGSRNDLLSEECLPSKHSEGSRNERNERNDFSNFSPTVKDEQSSPIHQDKSPPKIITPLHSLRDVPENLVQSEFEPRNDSRNAPPTDHYANDAQPESDIATGSLIQSVPEFIAEVESKPVMPPSLLEIEKSDGDINKYVDCQVEVRSCINAKVKCVGRLSSGSVSLEGNVGVITLIQGEKPAHIREVYLTENKPLLDRMLEVWDHDIDRGGVVLLAELALSVTPEQLQSTFAQCSPEQVEYINKAVFDLVESSVITIRDYIPESSYAEIKALTEAWPQEFKQAVWDRFTSAERKALNQIKVGEKDCDDNLDTESPLPANSDPAVDQVDISTSTCSDLQY